MSELAAVLGFMCFMLWLWLGGWAFGTIIRDGEDTGNDAGAFIVCLILGPAMAGIVIANRKRKP